MGMFQKMHYTAIDDYDGSRIEWDEYPTGTDENGIKMQVPLRAMRVVVVTTNMGPFTFKDNENAALWLAEKYQQPRDPESKIAVAQPGQIEAVASDAKKTANLKLVR